MRASSLLLNEPQSPGVGVRALLRLAILWHQVAVEETDQGVRRSSRVVVRVDAKRSFSRTPRLLGPK